MIAHVSYVMCDRCGNPGEVADNAKGARIVAAREGFVYRNGVDYCAAHAPISGGSR